jgi:cytochrome P450
MLRGMVTEAGPATLNILDPAFRVHSPQTAEAARRAWCAHTPLGIAVLRYEDCQAMMKDRRLRQVGVDHLIAQGITSGPLFEMWGRFVLNVEGPDHARLRRLFAPAFTTAAIDRLRPRMREIVHALIDQFAADGACEFMAAFADHYPPLVMAELLGLPPQEHEQFVAWGKAIADVLGYGVPQKLPAIEAALAALYASIDRIADERRRAPQQDLITVLVHASDDTRGTLDADELRANVAGLVLAGQDSTRGQLGLALEIFARHPAQWAQLAADPALAERATEEVLRANGVAPIVWRVATEDLEYHGTPIAAGTRLWLMVAAAHHDPAVFRDPQFDIQPTRAAQLSFGLGPHFCLGAQLTRVEMHEAFPILARRLPDLALAGEPAHRPQLAGFVGPERLPIRFTATANLRRGAVHDLDFQRT